MQGKASLGLTDYSLVDMLGVRYRGTSLIRNCPPPRTALGP